MSFSRNCLTSTNARSARVPGILQGTRHERQSAVDLPIALRTAHAELQAFTSAGAASIDSPTSAPESKEVGRLCGILCSSEPAQQRKVLLRAC